MAKFAYKAKRGLEDNLEGFIEATNREEALAKLVEQGFFPISIELAPAAAPTKEEKQKKRKKKPFRLLGNRISSGDILVFTQKLTTFIRARVDLLASLKMLYEQAEHPKFKSIILELYNVTKEGKAFSESLGRFPAIFPPLFVSIIRAGEASGRLDLSLEQINEYMQREEGLRTKISVALAYPSLLVFVGMASVFVLMNFVIPKLRPIFEGLRSELPLVTKIILRISMFSSRVWWGIFLVIIVLVMVVYLKKGSAVFKRLVRKIKIRVPIVSRLTHNQELAQFSRSLGILVKSGVPALRSLEIGTSTIENDLLRKQLGKVCQEVAQGRGISASMENYTELPSFFTKMVAVGEESGRISEVLDEMSRSYTQQIEADIALISSLIEPILIIVLGLILGSIVLAILLPTFQLTQMVM